MFDTEWAEIEAFACGYKAVVYCFEMPYDKEPSMQYYVAAQVHP